MGASCSSPRRSLDSVDAIDKNQSFATLADDPVLLELGFDAEICRLYDVVESPHQDSNTFKVIRKEASTLEKSGWLRSMMVAPNPAHPKPLVLKRVTSENPLSMMRLYHTLDILSQLHHPGLPRIIAIHDEDHSRVSFVMETCEGGSILDRAAPRYSESQARQILRQILAIVHYLHSKDIVHGDLRAEWFQFESTNPEDWRIQLTNFSMAQTVPKEESATSRPRLHHDHEPCCFATAPQILLNGRPHSKPGDMWSVGIVLYRLLSGQRPFGDSTADLLTNMRDGPTLAFPGPIWSSVSPQAKDLIQKLLVVEPKHRLTARQAMRHGWVSSFFSTGRRIR